MQYLVAIALVAAVVLAGCEPPRSEVSSMNPVNWKKRMIQLDDTASLVHGSTYLSVYSEIYERTEKLTYGLTVTVSLKNISSTDSVFIYRADYFNTNGDLIRTYFDKTIFIKPLETVEIVIDETDKNGGTGANFIFDWGTRHEYLEPHFEAVMISTTGQQGISFTTQGIRR